MGIPGFRNPVSHSYEIVRESVRLTRKRTEGSRSQVRPWLQDFKDYAFDKRIFGVSEIQAQVRGAGGSGRHRLDALEPPQRLHRAGASARRRPWRRSRRQ
jgi:hypothetical protein